MSSTTSSSADQYDEIDNTLRKVLNEFTELDLAILFGS
jgi:hypothetical protein